MKKLLMVSYDCGMSYHEEIRSDDINDFKEKIKMCNENMLRWVIEDENGNLNLEEIPSIHKNIINFLK